METSGCIEWTVRGSAMREEYLEFSIEQLEACTQLYVDVFNGEPWNDRWTLPAASQRLQDLLNTPGFFGVIVVREQPVAFVAGCREQWPDRVVFCLKEVCVRADLQGQGIGTRLLQHLDAELASRLGVTSVYLATMRDSPAEAFYRKNGYRTQERLVLMSRRVSPRTQ